MKCCFCNKDLSHENFIGNIRGGKGNKFLACLCKDCYDKLIKLQHCEPILQSVEEIV